MKKLLLILIGLGIVFTASYALFSKVCYKDQMVVTRNVILGLHQFPLTGEADVIVCIIN